MNHIRTSPTMQTRLAPTRSTRHSFRPWYKWLLTAIAFPPSGYLATLAVGRVDSVSSALAGGLIAGAGIGTAQWALLRHRGIGTMWIAANAFGLAAGLAAGAALVSYRTDITSLVVMGAISGAAVGAAQAVAFRSASRIVLWTVATSALWAIGWTATTLGGIHVEEQFVVFGAYGCLALALLQSTFIGAFIPSNPTNTEVTS